MYSAGETPGLPGHILLLFLTLYTLPLGGFSGLGFQTPLHAVGCISVWPGPLSSTSGLFMQLLTVYCLWDVPEAPLSTNITAPQACCTPPAPANMASPAAPAYRLETSMLLLLPSCPPPAPTPHIQSHSLRILLPMDAWVFNYHDLFLS